MKKIYSLAILLAACLGMVSCDEEKGEATALSTIKVLSAETSFESVADTGKVVLDCNPVKAYVDAEDQNWLDVQIDQNTVNLYAKLNGASESRNAMLVIKKNENDSILLNVDQKGLVFIVENKQDIVLYDDEAHEFTYKVNSVVAGDIISKPEWVDATMTKEKIDIKVTANNEAHLRQGSVKYKCGSVVDSIKVSQYDFDKDIKGDYVLLLGYNQETGKSQSYIPVSITESSMNFSFLYGTTTIDAFFNVGFDEEEIAFSIASEQTIGMVQVRNKYTYFTAIFASASGATLNRQDSNGNVIFGDETGLITAPLTYDEERGTYGIFSGDAYNNSGYQADFGQIVIGAFSNVIPYASTLVENSMWAMPGTLVLVKADSKVAAKAKATAKPFSIAK